MSPARWRAYGPRLAVTEWGILFLWGGVMAALLAAALGVLGPLPFLRPRPPGAAFFALIGAAYMIAEMTLLHEILFVLGRPALAVPLVVGGFLLVSGLGSLLWGSRRPVRFALAAGLILPATLGLIRVLGNGPGTLPGPAGARGPDHGRPLCRGPEPSGRREALLPGLGFRP